MQTLTLDRRDAARQNPVANGRRITDPRLPRQTFPNAVRASAASGGSDGSSTRKWYN